MNKQETAQLLAVIKTAFPHFEITDPVVRLWHEFMEGVTFDRAKKNLQNHIISNHFPPTISDIVKTEKRYGEALTVEETQLRLAEYAEMERRAVPMPKELENRWNGKALPRGDGS